MWQGCCRGCVAVAVLLRLCCMEDCTLLVWQRKELYLAGDVAGDMVMARGCLGYGKGEIVSDCRCVRRNTLPGCGCDRGSAVP